MRREFESRFTAAAKPFACVPLSLSFRSVPGVLAVIDKVFEHGDHKRGLTDDIWMRHEALKGNLPGLVEIWPLVNAAASDPPRGWKLPRDLHDAQDPATVVANRVAQKIKELITSEFVHDVDSQRRRPVRPGDILVLVRKRGDFFRGHDPRLETIRYPRRWSGQARPHQSHRRHGPDRRRARSALAAR